MADEEHLEHEHNSDLETWKEAGAPAACSRCGAQYKLMSPDAPKRCQCGADLTQTAKPLCPGCYDPNRDPGFN